MKRISVLFAALCIAFGAQAGELVNWKMQKQGDRHAYDVTVPCTVAGALNQAGALGPQVYERQNYKNIDKSLFDSPWVFSTTFPTQKGLRHVLRFESLGYSAEIKLTSPATP